ncbi:MAG: sorbosone dehydrogenase family protein [Leptolyngbyaceae cyanobacterium SL_1_1]|nr:sorbosone dehydrogenase family protein [Leptolyngbyaceae cyanobacterium SL_1_1]
MGLCLLTGCSTLQANPNAAESTRSTAPLSSPKGAAEPSSQPQTALPDRLIPTESFTPKPIQVQLSDLPEPYASESARKSPSVIPVPENPLLQVPEGFVVNVFADNLDQPRWLALTPEGDVLVTETRQNQIRLLGDRNRDGVAEINQAFADAQNGLDIPFGMAFAEGFFFLGNSNAVLRFPYQSGQQQLAGPGEKIADLPGGGYNQHWTRNVVAAPNGQQLFVSVGSRSNVGQEPLPRASVQVMNLDGSNQQTFADGLRNPVGLDFHPVTGALHTTVNERDGLGDDLVPDYFTRVQSGEFFGWPYAYLAPQNLDPRQLQGDRSRDPQKVAQTKTPDVLFQAHSAALGLQFYDGDTFPEAYRNGAFVAMRGSWNRSQGTGYKVVFIPFTADNRPVGYYEDFLKGFLVDPSGPTTWGRPVGLLVMPDGSLLVTEEMNNRIYRIQYVGS